MLTVGLDAEHTRQSAAGIARYALSLSAELRRIPGINLIDLGGGSVVPRGTLKKRLTTLRQDFVWYPWLARRAAVGQGAQIYHSPLPRGPLTPGSPPFVVTVHDLVAVRFPETTTQWSRIYGTVTLNRILNAADRIITPSKDTADDLNSLLSIDAHKIRVVPNGVDAHFFTATNAKPSVGGPYVLFVGTPEPRKNLHRLVSAMTVLRQRGFSERLVLVGEGGWGEQLRSDPHVSRMGGVSDDELLALYAGASCLAIPSLHEGFGLPALEAMAAGTPVVAGKTGALPEVIGNAGVLVDPLSSTSIADGIENAIAERASLITKGRARAREFTWGKAAALTASVYRELV
jgi:glycosyltransferase involved in cell wall biosynthesis